MFRYILILLLLIFTLLSGCAIQPQAKVDVDEKVWQTPNIKVGIMMSKIPEIDVHLPGASCLLCMAAAEVAMSGVSEHVSTLKPEGLAELSKEIANIADQKGYEYILIEEFFDESKLSDHSSENPRAARNNYSYYKDKYNISHLLVIDIKAHGINRAYSSYIPTSDPRGVFTGSSYLVDLSNNLYVWYLPINVYKNAVGNWDEPPAYPALTNSYYQALEMGKDIILAPIVHAKTHEEAMRLAAEEQSMPEAK